MQRLNLAPAMILGCALMAVAVLLPDLAFAQDIFKAPTSMLQQIKDFVLGAGGAILGGVVIAASALAAASPRTNFNWGGFFMVLLVVAVFFGAFGIAEVIQKASK